MFPGTAVCPSCCLLCPKRSICPNPAWKYSFELAPAKKPVKKAAGKEALLDLLSKLEGEK
ncbi:hypothetical protein ACSU1N_02715 [Thermogladius sp. 4427co]|uniref:hypothetical protein n=1 Tax=Thermogladius sp. 4427co TaxID=3450718 RepID=UPI003F7AE3AB